MFALLILSLSAAGASGCGKSPVDVPMGWDGDVETAVARAKVEHKLVFLFVGAEWDVAAKEIKRITLVDFEVSALLRRHFVSLHVDVTDSESPRAVELMRRFKVVGEPAILILAPNGTSELARFNEFVPPRILARALRTAIEDQRVREARLAAALHRH